MTRTRSERAAYMRAYHIAHHDKIIIRKKEWRVTHTKEIAAYNKIYLTTHRRESAAYSAAYRATYPEKCRAYSAAYATAHKKERAIYIANHLQKRAEKWRRYDARKRGATIGPIDLETIKVRDRMRCAICGKRVTEATLSFDHSWPLSLGGPHSQENQRVAHFHCNSKRGAGRLPVQMVLC